MFSSDNTFKAEILNLTEYDILFCPFVASAPTLVKKQHMPQVIDDVEELYLSIESATIPVCGRIVINPLPQKDGRYYIVSEKTKKCYKDRNDVLTINYCEGFTKEGYLIVRKLFS